MLLFKKPFWDGLTSGRIRLTFRRWQKPHVRAGGRYRCHPIGVLEVDAITQVAARDLTDDDARAAGFPDRAALAAYLAELGPMDDASPIYRIELHHAGDGDRVAIAMDAALTPADVTAITAKLARLDRRTPWTRATLAAIEAKPRVAASKLAAKLGRETLPFKQDVRKLKRLGLTQSFEVGYEIAPRGRAYLDATRTRTRRSRGTAATRRARTPRRRR